ncbi:light-independent protochlorophyllide reductase subunit N [Striga asiatica]|uniref:Light-independent protochlorophyllide reductase subunit N n=1 Tax=Striga asiatica TaxID=4170 RepID=A0A5A7RH45_STRAF|nr:light-independent protochlorophyllide reductase subunit N [Striga asiatica]
MAADSYDADDVLDNRICGGRLCEEVGAEQKGDAILGAATRELSGSLEEVEGEAEVAVAAAGRAAEGLEYAVVSGEDELASAVDGMAVDAECVVLEALSIVGLSRW